MDGVKLGRERKNEKGLTLIEVMIAIAISSILFLIAFSLFGFGNRTFSEGTYQSGVQSDLRTVSDYIVRNTRYATNLELINTLSLTEGNDYIQIDGNLMRHYRWTGTTHENFNLRHEITSYTFEGFRDGGKTILRVKLESGDDYEIVTEIDLPNMSLKNQEIGASGTVIRFSKSLEHAYTGGGTPTPPGNGNDDNGEIVNPVAVTGVSLNKSSTNLQVGQNETLIATVSPSNATNKNVTWSTDNSAIATVDNSGNITANAVGTATLTVTTADGGFTATCDIEVESPVFYTITFDTAGGNSVSPISQVAGTSITAPPNPTRFGYNFSGWSPSLPSIMPSNNLTVTAQWEEVDGPIANSLSGISGSSITINFNKAILSTSTPSNITASGQGTSSITYQRSGGFQNNATITVNVTSMDGGQSTIIISRSGNSNNWSIDEDGS